MAKEKIKAPAFDDIVFEERNKEYGAYKLRKKYNRNCYCFIANWYNYYRQLLLLHLTLMQKHWKTGAKRAERQVEIKMENLDQPNEAVAPPPPPPPPPADVVQQQKYVPPVVVDSVKPEDNVQLMTADEAQIEVKERGGC